MRSSDWSSDLCSSYLLNVGILPVTVSPEFLDKLFTAIIANPATEVEVSLPDQAIRLTSTGDSESFAINSYKKHNLMNGFDDIDYLQAMKDDIQQFAEKIGRATV